MDEREVVMTVAFKSAHPARVLERKVKALMLLGQHGLIELVKLIQSPDVDVVGTPAVAPHFARKGVRIVKGKKHREGVKT